MFSTHVTKDISAYCHGELSNQESKQFAEHIISCAKCRAKFEEVKLGIKLAEQLPQLSAPEHLWRELEPLLDRQTETLPNTRSPVFWNWRYQAAAAAALLLIAGVMALWLYNSRSSTPGPPQISQAGPKPSWSVKRLDGTPRIGSERISN